MLKQEKFRIRGILGLSLGKGLVQYQRRLFASLDGRLCGDLKGGNTKADHSHSTFTTVASNLQMGEKLLQGVIENETERRKCCVKGVWIITLVVCCSIKTPLATSTLIPWLNSFDICIW